MLDFIFLLVCWAIIGATLGVIFQRLSPQGRRNRAEIKRLREQQNALREQLNTLRNADDP